MDLTLFNPFRALTRSLSPSGRTLGARQGTGTTRVVALPKNGVFDLDRPAGCRIECLRGSLWITQIGDGRDIVVEAGTQFLVDRDIPMFVQALDAAEFRID